MRSHEGLKMVENHRINLAQKWADPRKLSTSNWFSGLGAITMALRAH